MDLISMQIEQKKLRKYVEIDESLLGIEFSSDKQRISQVLVNLLSNSLKFTYKGFIKLKVENIHDYDIENEDIMMHTNRMN